MFNTSTLVIAFLLVSLASVLVAADTALTRVSRSTIELLKKDGNRRAAILFKMLDHRAKYVNALLFAHLSLSTISIVLVTDTLSTLIGPNLTSVFAAGFRW